MYRRFERFERRFRRRQRYIELPRPRLRDRSDPLENYDEEQFRTRFHMNKSTAHFVIDLIAEDLTCPIRRGVHLAPGIQFLIAQRFFATGTFQLVLGDLTTVSQSTVSRIVQRVSKAICKHSKRFIYFPTFQESAKVIEDFANIANFPGRCLCSSHFC